MEAKTHIITSLTIAAAVSKYAAIPFTAGYIAGAALGSVLPDLDKKDSFIGKRSFGLSRVVQLLFGHRGFTHSLFCWVLISIICLYYPSPFTYGLSIGYIGHIMGDFFSNRGVPLLYPILKKPLNPSHFITYRTGGTSETFILVISVIVLLTLILEEPLVNDFVQSIKVFVYDE
ncbi:metal-dependent hydrolase [Aquisalibacillus elongatus]|uniref:Inner membrane protein n=1 Tax=Aquisalibacillus elongatus TaxID=485577 RepID=A0A3N5B4Y2_9BACI|nr:metal-dependent hydrolase [Aquisalibacillus elongatus]RPF52169.1 inner membrane protein [Aquisalibacillus elongatus]